MDERVIVTKPIVGICHMQVCVVEDASDEEIIDTCNKENPSGTTGGWKQVERYDVVSCDKYPGRNHMCVVC